MEDRARGRRELVSAIDAGVFAARPRHLASASILNFAVYPVSRLTSALGTIWLAARLRVAKRNEHIDRLLLGHASYALGIKRPCSCRGEKMLRLILRCSEIASNLMNKSGAVK